MGHAEMAEKKIKSKKWKSEDKQQKQTALLELTPISRYFKLLEREGFDPYSKKLGQDNMLPLYLLKKRILG